MSGAVATRPHPVGWGAVVAGLLGLLALVLPWYAPKLSKPVDGVTDLGVSYHAWSGFAFMVAAPILLIVFAVLWLQALRGRHNSRFAGSANPTRSLSLQSVVAGVVAFALGLLSFVLMSHHYTDWNQLTEKIKPLGATLQKNPQPGLYALLVGALLLIAVGIAGLVLAGRTGPAAVGTPGAPTPGDYGTAPAGYGTSRDGDYPPASPPQR